MNCQKHMSHCTCRDGGAGGLGFTFKPKQILINKNDNIIKQEKEKKNNQKKQKNKTNFLKH